MSWRPDYCTLDQLKDHLRITDINDDLELEICITAASRAIDYETNRQFGLTGSAVPRLYTYETAGQDWRASGFSYGYGVGLIHGEKLDGRPALRVDDVQTTSGMALAFDMDGDGTYETSLTLGVDYDMWPWNAAANGTPWTYIVLHPTAQAFFPTWAKAIQFTANFGWSAVPQQIVNATLIQAARFFVRRDSAYGVAGSPSDGSQVRLLARLDPDVALMLTSCRRVFGAIQS